LISAELSVNKGWKGSRAESRWVISHCLKYGRIAIHKTHLLSQ
jgi:hypothetical protein